MPAANGPTETYVVRAGDWLAKIAEEHNSTVSAIWDHPANATLRSQRGTPDVLYPGDVLHIPREPPIAPPTPPAMPPPDAVPPWPYEHEKSWNSFPTWACSASNCQCDLHAEDVRYEHTITFHDLDGHRLSDARCRVYENGKLITPEPTQTDGEGRLTVTLRASTTSLFLEWAPPSVPLARGLPYRKHYRLAKDHAFERSSHATTQLRLANLGFQEARAHRHNLEAYKRAYHMAEHVSAQKAAVQARRCHDGGTLPPFPPAPAPHEKAIFESPNDAPTGSPPEVIPVQHDLPGGATEQEAGSSVPDSTNITVGVTAGGFRGDQFKCVKLSLVLRSITTPSSHPEFVGKVNTLLSHDIKKTEEHGVDFLFLKLPRGEYTAVGSVRARRGGNDEWYAGTLEIRTADGNPPSPSPPDPSQSGRGWIFRSMALTKYTLSVTGPSTAYSGQTVRFFAAPLGGPIGGPFGGPIGWSLSSGSKGSLGLVAAPLHHSVEYTAGPPGTATVIATDPCGQTASASITISKKIVVKNRLLVVVGTEHLNSGITANPANKLVFLAQAVRACREHGRHFDEATVMVFEAGYKANWLARAEKSVKGYGATFRTITSWDDVVKYVNGYKVTGKDEDTYHRIETMMIFGHGYPGILALNGKVHPIKIHEIRKLDPEAFRARAPSGKLEGPPAQVSSWACQTANKGVDSSEGDNLEGSLAKAMADHLGKHGTNVEVFGFGRRTNYGPTWSNPTFGKEEKLDGHLWQDVGGDNPVKVGDTSTNGIMSDKMWRFKHGAPVAAGVPRLR